MGQGRARVFNIITLIVLIATIVFAVWVVLRLLQPPVAPAQTVAAVPTLQQFPTLTPTSTASITPLPSFTPSFTPEPPTVAPTRTFTNTPVPTVPTNTPTVTPSLTATLTLTLIPTSTRTPVPSETIAPTITLSPTITLTLAASLTPESQFVAQPTQAPPSPFPFGLKDGQVIFTQNFANAAGCAWQGIGGQVFDVDNQPFTGARVHVFGNGLDTYAQAGSNSLYGPSGWEVPVATSLSGNTYLVELQTASGTIISQPVTVAFTANDCTRNLGLVNFAANRAF